eukprot:scaffold60396_cov35-Tisochrysis_lutea.AAC.1
MEYGVAANDLFCIGYSDGSTMHMSKAELLDKLTDTNNPKLKEDERWILRDKLTDWRFVLCGIHGVHARCA